MGGNKQVQYSKKTGNGVIVQACWREEVEYYTESSSWHLKICIVDLGKFSFCFFCFFFFSAGGKYAKLSTRAVFPFSLATTCNQVICRQACIPRNRVPRTQYTCFSNGFEDTGITMLMGNNAKETDNNLDFRYDTADVTDSFRIYCQDLLFCLGPPQIDRRASGGPWETGEFFFFFNFKILGGVFSNQQLVQFKQRHSTQIQRR